MFPYKVFCVPGASSNASLGLDESFNQTPSGAHKHRQVTAVTIDVDNRLWGRCDLGNKYTVVCHTSFTKNIDNCVNFISPSCTHCLLKVTRTPFLCSHYPHLIPTFQPSLFILSSDNPLHPHPQSPLPYTLHAVL